MQDLHGPLTLASAEESSEWVTTGQAATVLCVSTRRVRQLAVAGLIPFEIGPNGRRRYRRRQIQVIANARLARWHGFNNS